MRSDNDFVPQNRSLLVTVFRVKMAANVLLLEEPFTIPVNVWETITEPYVKSVSEEAYDTIPAVVSYVRCGIMLLFECVQCKCK